MHIKLLQTALTQYLHKPPHSHLDQLTSRFIKEQTHKPGCFVIVHGTSLIEENNKPNDLDILIFTQGEAGRLKVDNLDLVIEMSLCLKKVQEYAFHSSFRTSQDNQMMYLQYSENNSLIYSAPQAKDPSFQALGPLCLINPKINLEHFKDSDLEKIFKLFELSHGQEKLKKTSIGQIQKAAMHNKAMIKNMEARYHLNRALIQKAKHHTDALLKDAAQRELHIAFKWQSLSRRALLKEAYQNQVVVLIKAFEFKKYAFLTIEQIQNFFETVIEHAWLYKPDLYYPEIFTKARKLLDDYINHLEKHITESFTKIETTFKYSNPTTFKISLDAITAEANHLIQIKELLEKLSRIHAQSQSIYPGNLAIEDLIKKINDITEHHRSLKNIHSEQITLIPELNKNLTPLIVVDNTSTFKTHFDSMTQQLTDFFKKHPDHPWKNLPFLDFVEHNYGTDKRDAFKNNRLQIDYSVYTLSNLEQIYQLFKQQDVQEKRCIEDVPEFPKNNAYTADFIPLQKASSFDLDNQPKENGGSQHSGCTWQSDSSESSLQPLNTSILKLLKECHLKSTPDILLFFCIHTFNNLDEVPHTDEEPKKIIDSFEKYLRQIFSEKEYLRILNAMMLWEQKLLAGKQSTAYHQLQILSKTLCKLGHKFKKISPSANDSLQTQQYKESLIECVVKTSEALPFIQTAPNYKELSHFAIKSSPNTNKNSLYFFLSLMALSLFFLVKSTDQESESNHSNRIFFFAFLILGFATLNRKSTPIAFKKCQSIEALNDFLEKESYTVQAFKQLDKVLFMTEKFKEESKEFAFRLIFGNIYTYLDTLQKELLLKGQKNKPELFIYLDKIKKGTFQSIAPFKKGGDASLSQFQVEITKLLKLKD